MGYQPQTPTITSPTTGGNSTVTPLGGSATFTGTGELNTAPDVMVSCFTDEDGTLFFDFSNDGTNWDSVFPPNGFEVTGGINEFHIAVKGPRYFRCRLVNGSVAQTVLRLYTHYGSFKDGRSPISSTIGADADAIIVRSVDSRIDLALGRFQGMVSDTKFGRVSNLDAADPPVDIWAFGDDTVSPRSSAKTFPTSAATIYLASSNAGDTTQTVDVDYIDANGDAQTASAVALNGQTPVSIGATGLDVNRIKVVSATGAAGVVYASITNNFTGGAPNNVTDILAVAPAGYQQSQLSHFTVPLGKTLIMNRIFLSVARSSGSAGSARVLLKMKPFGQAERVIREFFLTTNYPIDPDNIALVIPARAQITWEVSSVSDTDSSFSVAWGYDLVAD